MLVLASWSGVLTHTRQDKHVLQANQAHRVVTVHHSTPDLVRTWFQCTGHGHSSVDLRPLSVLYSTRTRWFISWLHVGRDGSIMLANRGSPSRALRTVINALQHVVAPPAHARTSSAPRPPSLTSRLSGHLDESSPAAESFHSISEGFHKKMCSTISTFSISC